MSDKIKILCITIGLPASGKSSWAKKYVRDNRGWIRISNDDLRLALFDRKFCKSDTKYIDAIRKNLIDFAISRGLNIIVDNCNLHPRHRVNYMKIALENKYEFLIQDFTNVPVAECIARDKMRPNRVGAFTIVDMYNKFLLPDGQGPLRADDPQLKAQLLVMQNIRANQDINLPKAIICDLDGTIALNDHRDPYDASNCDEDDVNSAVVAVVMAMKARGYRIIFVSGRMDKYVEPTVKFLKEKVGLKENEYLLFMRKTDDCRKDAIVKEEIYNNFIKGNFYVEFVLDDRDSVVSFWRGIGLSCFQVNYGNF